jgi:uncharacterized protein (DUF1697 family)
MTTRRYAAFLRGVSPLNAKMPELRRCLEAAGFSDVKTVRSSGNVVFGSTAAGQAALERRIEAAMEKHLGRSFLTIVRPLDALRALIASNPYRGYRIAPDAKRIVTFLRKECGSLSKIPAEVDGGRILYIRGTEIFSVYVPSPRASAFMRLIEKTAGDAITTRTWETIKNVAAA